MKERLLGVVAAVVLTAGIVAAVTEPRSSDDPVSLVAGAGDAAVEAGTARLAMRYEMTSEEAKLGFSATGAIDFTSNRGQLTLTAGGQDFDIRNDGATTYVSVAEASRSLSNGLPWVSYPTDDANTSDLDLGGGARLDLASPTSLLEQLTAIGEVEDLGDDEVNGAESVHYRTTIDLAAELRSSLEDSAARSGERIEDVLDELEPSPAVLDVWIADELPTRISLTSTFGFVGPSLTQRIELDLTDYGIAVDVVVPPANEVYAADANVLAKLLQPAFAAMLPASSGATTSTGGVLAFGASDAVTARYCAAHAQLMQLIDSGGDAGGIEDALTEIDGAAEDARAEGAISSWASMTAVASAARAYITTARMGSDTSGARELLTTVSSTVSATCR